MAEDEEEYFVPLQDQRVFGAGIKRKRVTFVPSTQVQSREAPVKDSRQGNVGDYYLSLVLPEAPSDAQGDSLTNRTGERLPVCGICNLPIFSTLEKEETNASASSTKPHESSLAHQVCLSHSHPPSHLDRQHKGLQYLSSYGWDPDSRNGLGLAGEGIRFPIKGVVKRDNSGVGIKAPGNGAKAVMKKKKEEKLNAKEVRKKEENETMKRKRLQEMFYSNEDLEKYLGSVP
ncbi:MAG: hypothetical protein M1837_003108 [Sclerophora amabilis]|nr:MAG: hypothetical protein M1837_003108 [Sclerophora amabilis]